MQSTRLPAEQVPATVGAAVPPQLQGKYRGEVEVHVPAFGARSSVGSRAARQVGIQVLWWGMAEDDEGQPRLVATKLRERALRTLQNTHGSQRNTVWHPIVVQRPALGRYLATMVSELQRQSLNATVTSRGFRPKHG